MYKNILILGRGIGQVMFQNNALSGGLMLLGIAFNSWQLAVLSVLGTVVSTLTASLSGYDKEDIRNGLYGFNDSTLYFCCMASACWVSLSIPFFTVIFIVGKA